jgi:predicted negative regulator of RcsB-dependent stress response
LDIYRTDEEQADALKKWWLENGKSIFAGIAIGLTAIFGWRAWQDYTITQAEAASSEYQQMVVAVRQGKNDVASEHANTIIEDYNSTSYAHFAALQLAKIAVDNKEYANAEAHLRRVIDNTSQDQIRHIARLRLARSLIAQKKLVEADAMLNIDGKGNFMASYEELRGDIFVLQGMTEAARNAYKEALTGADTKGERRSILQMKMDVLGRK